MNYDTKQLPPTQSAADAAYSGSTENARYAPRLKIYTGTATAIQTGLINAGHFGLEHRKDAITPLGLACDAIVFARKRFALDTSVPGKPVRSYDPDSDIYQAIKAKVDAKVDKRNYQYGMLYLLFERSSGKFCELFCAPPSWRDEVTDALAPYLPVSQDDIDRWAAEGVDVSAMSPKQPGLVTLTSKFIDKPGQKWHVPVVSECKTPFANAPSLDAVIREVQKFFASVTEESGAGEKLTDSGRTH